MSRRVLLCVLSFLALSLSGAAQAPAGSRPAAAAIRYGDNAAAGKYFVHDGVRLYYEIYGKGEPLLMVHGNGGSIADFGAQIAHFKQHYQVIAMDSRDQGKSGDSTGRLTYEKMSDDLDALLDEVKVGPVNVLGWSDGAIEALLLGIRHPEKVKKIAAMAANLNPTDEAVHPDVLDAVKEMLSDVPAPAKDLPEDRRELKLTRLLLEEPHIELKALEAITAPTLVLAGDHDVIRDEHTVAIFQHLPNSELAIFPNSTHMVPFDDPALFNSTVERFVRTPFVKRDRVKDTFTSLERLRSSTDKR
jgi:pimeloyl-ACP methyl ester carboxylesterase